MPDLRLSIISIIAAVAALVLVFELLRRRRLREKYAAIWIVIAVGTVVVAVFPQILRGWPTSSASRRRPTCCSSGR